MSSICWRAICIRQFKTKYCQFSKFRLIHREESRDTFQEWTAHDKKIVDGWNIMYSWVWAVKLCHALASYSVQKADWPRHEGEYSFLFKIRTCTVFIFFIEWIFSWASRRKTLFFQYLHIVFHFWAIRAFWPPFSILSYSRWWRL